MTEERITEVETPQGNTHTTTTVISDEPRSSGISIWFVLFLVLAAVLIGLWAFTQMGGAEVAKDNAMADAAEQVGNAAENVGDAAQQAGDAVESAAENSAGQ